MTDIAHQLRAQKRYSTDPYYLERMALEEELLNDLNPSHVTSRKKEALDEGRPGSQERL